MLQESTARVIEHAVHNLAAPPHWNKASECDRKQIPQDIAEH